MNTESKKITFSFFFSLGLILVSFIVGQPDPPQAAGQIQAPGPDRLYILPEGGDIPLATPDGALGVQVQHRGG